MGALDRWRSLPVEDRRYIGAAAMGVAGITVWALAIRQRLRPPPLATYGDPSCPESVYQEVLTGTGLSATKAHRAWYYAPIIIAAAQHWDVPADIMMGIVQTESGFNPKAGSPAGARGLAQLMPGTARSLHKILVEMGQWPFGELDRDEPAQSAWLGAYLMHRLLHGRGRSMKYALAGYNAGNLVKPGMPESEWPRETRRYVPAVLRRAPRYRKIWERCRALAA